MWNWHAVIPSNVVVLTPETIDQIVLDATNDVLVELHAPRLVFDPDALFPFFSSK